MPILGEVEAQPIWTKAEVFAQMDYQPHAEEVKAFHESEAKVRIITAPARTSKSYSAFPECVYCALPHKPLLGSLQWIVGTNYDTNKEFQYVYNMLVDQRERWTLEGRLPIRIENARNNPSNGDMQIVIDWGRTKYGRARAVIEGKSSNNEKSLQGEHVTQIIMSEAADHESRVWEQYLSTRYTWAIFPTTPKQNGQWLRDMSEIGERDPSLSIETFRYPPHANPFYDYEKFERERKKAEARTESGNAEDDPFFAEQFLGRWSFYTGRVLPLYDQNLVDLDPAWLDDARIYVSCDYGYEDACVALFWAALPSGALLIWDEIYERHVLTADFVAQIVQRLEAHKGRFGYACGDPKQPQVAHYFAEHGLTVVNMNKRAQSDRAVGHRMLVDLLSVDPDRGHPMLFVASHCKRTIAEWRQLRYRENLTNEYGSNALRGDDHAFDAAKYFVTTRPQPQAAPQRPDWLRELERQRRENARIHGGAYNATRGLARWSLTGRSPYVGVAHGR